ncbi:hypothetical protein Dimus_016421 [Dionaea muscipula]
MVESRRSSLVAIHADARSLLENRRHTWASVSHDRTDDELTARLRTSAARRVSPLAECHEAARRRGSVVRETEPPPARAHCSLLVRIGRGGHRSAARQGAHRPCDGAIEPHCSSSRPVARGARPLATHGGRSLPSVSGRSWDGARARAWWRTPTAAAHRSQPSRMPSLASSSRRCTSRMWVIPCAGSGLHDHPLAAWPSHEIKPPI